MIQTVIFDMDGVIIDSEPIHFKLEAQMFEELKIDVPVAEHYSFMGMSSPNLWAAIVKKYNLTFSPQELVKKKQKLYLEHLQKGSDLHPVHGVTELLQELQENKFTMVLASSSDMVDIDIVLTKFNLSGYFKAKVSGTELVHSKPHPEIFLRAAGLVDSEPEECLVIEDSTNGVTAAKAAGMKCIGFLNPNSGPQNLDAADLIIKSFKELNADFIKNF